MGNSVKNGKKDIKKRAVQSLNISVKKDDKKKKTNTKREFNNQKLTKPAAGVKKTNLVSNKKLEKK